MPSRLCVCGCGQDARPGSRYALEHHRKRVYNRKLADARKAAGLPEHLNLATLTDTTEARPRDTQGGVHKRQRRSVDLRVSYLRAVEAVATSIAQDQRYLDVLIDGDTAVRPEDFRGVAEEILRPLLTPKQLAALEQRSAA